MSRAPTNVYVVKQDDTVNVRSVEIGETYGSDWIIKKGASQRVSGSSSEGFQKVRSGMKVDPRPMKTSKGEDPSGSKAPSQTQSG